MSALAIEGDRSARAPIPEARPPFIEISVEYARDIAISYLQSRRRLEPQGPNQEEILAYDSGLVEVREKFLRMIGQKHLIENPCSEVSRHPLLVTPVRISVEQVNELGTFYETIRKSHVDMDVNAWGKIGSAGIRVHAQMIELASILFHLGQGERVREIDEKIGRSPNDLRREETVRTWGQTH